MTEAYIHPMLRGSDREYPPLLDAERPFPLHTLTAAGSWDAFRYRVWRSLLVYETRDLTYECVLATRLADIQMAREKDLDDGFDSRRALATTPLLILAILDGTTFNPLTAQVFNMLLQERTVEGRPSWIYTALTGNALARVVGDDSARRWFSSLQWFGVGAPAHGPSVATLPASPSTLRDQDTPLGSLGDLAGQPPDAPAGGQSSRKYHL
jgi:hypothetical protein